MDTKPKSKWDEQKEMLKPRIAALTHGELRFDLGKIEEMLEILHIKLNKTMKELHKTTEKLTRIGQ